MAIRATFLADFDSFTAAVRRAERELDGFERSLKRTGQELSTIGKAASVALTAPIVGGLTLAAKAAIDFESSFAGVRKTVEATEPELQMLARGFRDMAREIPLNVNELNRIGEAAGQLGIETRHILSFARVMADLGVTTNLSATEAATALARLANITQMPQTEFDRLGSTIVALGNQFATTEREIVDMSLRLAGAGAQIGMTEHQILAMATALSSLGIEAEAGGTALSRVMVEVAKRVDEGGAKLEALARVAGESADVFARRFRDDAADAIRQFITGLGRVGATGESVFRVLAELGLENVRVRDALLRTAGAGDLLARALEAGATAWQQNRALAQEAAQRYQTVESQLQLLRNQLTELGIEIGMRLLPVIRDWITAARPVIEWAVALAQRFSELPQPVQTASFAFAGLLAAIGPVLWSLGQLLQTMGTLVGSRVFATVATSLAMLTRELWAARAASVAFYAALLGPAAKLAGVVGAVVAVSAAIVELGGRLAEWAGVSTEVGRVQTRLADITGQTVTPRLESLGETLPRVTRAFADLDARAIRPVTEGLAQLGREEEVYGRAVTHATVMTGQQQRAMRDVREEARALAGSLQRLWSSYVTDATLAASATDAVWEQFYRLTDQVVRISGPLRDQVVGAFRDLAQLMPTIAAQRPADLLRWQFSSLASAARQAGDVIVQAVTGGGRILASLGAALGRGLGEDLSRHLGSTLSRRLGETIGGAVASALPGIGALLGPALGGVGRWIGGLFRDRRAEDIRQHAGAIQAITDRLVEMSGGLEQADRLARGLGLTLVSGELGHQGRRGLEQLTRYADEFAGRLRAVQEELERVSQRGGLISSEAAQFRDVVGRSHEAVARFLDQQAAVARESVRTFLESATITTADGGRAMAALLLAAWDGTAEGLRRLQPDLGRLQEALRAAGIEGGAAFDHVIALSAVASDRIAGPMLQAIHAATRGLETLWNVGLLTQDSFTGLVGEVMALRDRLLEQGHSAEMVHALMQRDLQTIWQLVRDHGFAVDETTRELLEQAEASGVVGDRFRDATDRMVLAVERLADLFEEAFGRRLPQAAAAGAAHATAAIHSIPRSVDVEIRGHLRLPELIDGEWTGPGFQRGTRGETGSWWRDFGRGSPVLLHDVEAVIRPDQLSAFLADHGPRAPAGPVVTPIGSEAADGWIALRAELARQTEVLRVALRDALLQHA